jgi:hypothetical protein
MGGSGFCFSNKGDTVSAENDNKMRMVSDLINGSKYRTAAQQFLNQKGVLLECEYYYAVSSPTEQKAASYVFFATDKTKYGYFVKVNQATNTVTEWYRNDDITTSTTGATKWFALDISSNQPIEYYVLESVNGIEVEKKFDYSTNQEMAINYFQRFYAMTTEQQELIKDLPFKRTSVCWSNKHGGFVVEFLPTYFSDVYEGINMANLHLLEV